eukprot:INCI4114.4.p1 GENE.INCI4114.4~~INCI4114.4.p1  ORF type:complete len:801 (-),score=131.60 INCI4114.4:158-2410(-)
MKLHASCLALATTALMAAPSSATDGPCTSTANISALPFCNQSLDFSERAADLLKRMTVEEKLSQMGTVAAAVPRLSLPAVSFSTEALHGVWSTCVPTSSSRSCSCSGPSGACSGSGCACPTIFPTPISLGATFDAGLWKSVGSAVGREARALEAFGGVAGGSSSQQATVGAVLSSPNVNVLRDGRWGRSQELVGEDPRVIGDYAANFIGGVQFTSHRPNATAYVLGLGACEYFAGYSLDCVTAEGQACASSSSSSDGNSVSGTFDAAISPWDLSESYLPAFSACSRALAGGITCAANSVNGVPSCADGALLNGTLRGEFGFEGFVAAAGSAVAEISVPFHNFTKSLETAAAAALTAGTDRDNGETFDSSLASALSAGLVSEAAVDAAVQRLLVARLRLGGLDFADGTSAYGTAKTSDLTTTTHVALNERASYEGIVLLQNNVTSGSESPTGRPARRLPLAVSRIKKVAVMGPHATARLNLLGSEHGAYLNGSIVSPADFLVQRLGSETVDVTPGCNVSSCDPDALSEAVSVANGADVVVMGLGLCGMSPGSGDSSCADAAGYYEAAGYDRASLALPPAQVQLVKAVAATGKPIVAFLLNGGPLDVSEITPLLEGLLWAGYPGSTGGKAIGSAFVGLLSPGSVMPYTTPTAAAIAVQPSYSNMSMLAGAGRTYKFFTGDAAFPFGFGLSYSHWVGTVEGPESGSVAETGAAHFTIALQNDGPYSGDRVVLLFAEPRVRLHSQMPVWCVLVQ